MSIVKLPVSYIASEDFQYFIYSTNWKAAIPPDLPQNIFKGSHTRCPNIFIKPKKWQLFHRALPSDRLRSLKFVIRVSLGKCNKFRVCLGLQHKVDFLWDTLMTTSQLGPGVTPQRLYAENLNIALHYQQQEIIAQDYAL